VEDLQAKVRLQTKIANDPEDVHSDGHTGGMAVLGLKPTKVGENRALQAD